MGGRAVLTIVEATIAMTKTLGMTLVAEGVESEDQRKFLVAQDCDRMQGYHLGRPVPAEELDLERRACHDHGAASVHLAFESPDENLA